MIKDSFKLNKNAWHAKLMEHMWGVKPRDFSHMCPYFWLSVFNIIVSPIYYPLRYLVVVPIIKACVAISKYSERKEEEWFQNYYTLIKNDPAALENLASRDLDKKCNKRYREFVYSFVKYEKADEALYKAFKVRQRELAEVYEKKRQAASKARINKNIKWVKPVTTVFLYILAGATLLLAGYGTYKLVVYLVHVPAHNWGVFFQRLGNILLVVGIAGVAIGIIAYLASLKMGCKTKRALGTPFRAIGSFFKFIGQMFSDNCPAIVWEDK